MEDRRVRDDLAAELDRHGREVVARLHLYSPERNAQRLVESGWSQWEFVAHLAAIEWTLPRLLRAADTLGVERGSNAPSNPVMGEGSDATKLAPMQGGIDAYNKREVERRQGRPLETLVSEFALNREATVAAVRAATPGIFQRRIRSAGGLDGILADVLRTLAVAHVDQHLAEAPPPL